MGLSHARNAGGKFAQSDYVGYIDDDAKATPQYIEILLNVLSNHSPDICRGPHYPFYLDAKPIWFLDRYGTGCFFGDYPRYLTQFEYLSGTNIIFRRSLLYEVGCFNPSFGMKGKKIWYGEETMVMINAWKANHDLRVYYDPKLFVYHIVPARKMSILNKMKTFFQSGRSQVYFWLPEVDQKKLRHNAPWALFRTILRLFTKELVEIMFRDRRKYPYWQNYVYEKTFQRFSFIGSQIALISDRLLSRK